MMSDNERDIDDIRKEIADGILGASQAAHDRWIGSLRSDQMEDAISVQRGDETVADVVDRWVRETEECA